MDLEHDGSDRLTAVENETSGNTIQYTYDGQGRRVAATEGTSQRRFLVAPAMGGGLESTDLISDANGNLISNYVYAGGSSPFMRLDASGNPIYYLTDAMGSTIGLADGTGASAAKFNYDSFGNLRSSSGAAANTGIAGGDFRFQGQWLEQGTGIYNFRARDYDAKTGTFLSRDPVDIIETEPESFNPYQFVYNNPHVYSDPTGMFTITELKAAENLEAQLFAVRRYAAAQTKDYIFEKLGDSVGNIAISIFNNFLPGSPLGNSFLASIHDNDITRIFELELNDMVCAYFEGIPLIDSVRFEPRIALEGDPLSPGLNCSNLYQPQQFANQLAAQPGSRPDFLFIQGNYALENPNSYLIGDLKLTQRAAYDAVTGNDRQWQAMSNYARRYQLLPFVSYVSLIETMPGERGVSKTNRKEMAKEATEKGVILASINLID